MEYPNLQIASYCPNWKSQIINGEDLKLDDDFDLNGVRNFFDGILLENIIIDQENYQTILQLGQLSGSEVIVSEVQKFINDKIKTIPEILEEMVNEKDHQISNTQNEEKSNSLAKEAYASKHYNEMLQYPEILKNVDIPQHMRIVKQALSYYGKNNFNYRLYISFILDQLENENNQRYNVLLTILTLEDFDIQEIERLCKCKSFDQNMFNSNFVSFITKMKENDEKLIEQEEKINSLQFQFTEMKQMTSKILTMLTQIKNENEEFQTQAVNILNNQQNSINELKLRNLGLQMTNLQNSQNEIKHKNDQIINEILPSFKKELTDKLNDAILIKNEVNKIKNDANLIKNDVKQILKKVDDNLNLTLAQYKSCKGIIHTLKDMYGNADNVVSITSSSQYRSYDPKKCNRF